MPDKRRDLRGETIRLIRAAGRARIHAQQVKWLAERTLARIEDAFPGCTERAMRASRADAQLRDSQAKTPAKAREYLKRAKWRAEEARKALDSLLKRED